MTEKLLNEQVARQVRDVFKQLKDPVVVMYFGTHGDCQYCGETLQLIEEVTALSEKLSLEIYDLEEDADIASQYHVDKAPGLVIAGRDGEKTLDFGVRYAGIPSGHEFSALIHDLVLVSGRDSGLKPETRAFLAELKSPVLLQVFSTPT